MSEKPNIICTGTLDTKGDEIKFIAEKVKEFGGQPIIMDLSLGGEVDWADISLDEVLSVNNEQKEEVFQLSRSDAIDVVGQAGAVKIKELYKDGKVDGIISWAGSVGTSTVTTVMRALPFGIPKIMMCTLASGDVSSWLGNKDIYILNPVSEKGINRVTRKIVSKAAAGIVNMGRAEIKEMEVNSLAALTAYGTTTPTVMKCADHMEDNGWDTMMVHQVGTGATMEDLIRSGEIEAVFDITTGELSNEMLGSIYGLPDTWKGERLTAASEMGIPQIVCPGGLAQVAYGALDTVSESILEDFKTGERVSYQNSKEPYVHNSAVTIIPPTLEETKTLGKQIIEKLNKTNGPTALIVPMQGWSAYDQPEELANRERGWAKGNGDGPVWMPDPEIPKWSKRAMVMWSVFKEKVNNDNENLDLIKCDMHILDKEFASFLCDCMDDMLRGDWESGMYRGHPKVVE
ncbi:Tm-1-like ATP-binding domain-containing protein [Sporohalobacter salinus]|uniref:Tm-1-like ATP-binding domain-containing protein n=1 Tax=Sporohalobacter salinus TaxID=1494606 RepID=UPI0019612B58|nr:Tm-1-like ATP-binding domain-containing protein [Sporohalobacter salinus]MBM7623373.1 uncharacterized protein (UPF0261 family) [Sporohalobacter salinus]